MGEFNAPKMYDTFSHFNDTTNVTKLTSVHLEKIMSF